MSAAGPRPAHEAAIAEVRRAAEAAAAGGGARPAPATRRAARCCRATASARCSTPAARSWRWGSSPPTGFTTAQHPARA